MFQPKIQKKMHEYNLKWSSYICEERRRPLLPTGTWRLPSKDPLKTLPRRLTAGDTFKVSIFMEFWRSVTSSTLVTISVLFSLLFTVIWDRSLNIHLTVYHRYFIQILFCTYSWQLVILTTRIHYYYDMYLYRPLLHFFQKVMLYILLKLLKPKYFIIVGNRCVIVLHRNIIALTFYESLFIQT
jgi:predicted neutral ceramidase superfamily lipid hydrolase